MKAADVQLVIAVISTAGIVLVALYNGWINSRRSREERTSASYADLIKQVKEYSDRMQDARDRIDRLEAGRKELRETITELRADLRTERDAREDIHDDVAQFVDSIARYALGQATKPDLPDMLTRRVDLDLWAQIPQDQRRFRLPGDKDGDHEPSDSSRDDR